MTAKTSTATWEARKRVLLDAVTYPTIQHCADALGASKRSVNLWINTLRGLSVKVPERNGAANKTVGGLLQQVKILTTEVTELRAALVVAKEMGK